MNKLSEKAKAYRTELVEKYKKYDSMDYRNVNPISCLARDNKRKIRKVFEKVFHEPIDKYLDV